MEARDNKTPREVAEEIRADLRRQNLNIREAAERLGISPANLSAILARDTFMGRTNAARLADTFGYDTIFLHTGVGTLRGGTGGSGAAGSTPPAVDIQLRQVLSVCVGISAAVGSLQRQVADLAAALREAQRAQKIG